VIEQVGRFSVAAPSWAMGTGSTRFGRFPGPGEAGGRSRRRWTTSPPSTHSPARTARSASTCRGIARGSGGAPALRRVARGGVRRHELEHVPGPPLHHLRRTRLLQVRVDVRGVPRGPRGRGRAQPRRDRDRGAARVDGAHGLARRRHEPPRPGRLPPPVRAGGRVHARRARRTPRRVAHVHGAQTLRAGVLLVGERGLGLVAAPRAGRRTAGEVPRRPGPPPAGVQRRAGRESPRHGRAARRVPLQRLQVRRRRSHRRSINPYQLFLVLLELVVFGDGALPRSPT